MVRATLSAIAATGALLPSAALAVAIVTPSSLVKNGDFSATTAGQSRQMSDGNGVQYVSNWINDGGGYNFIVTGDATVTPNGNAQSGVLSNSYGYIALWGKNNAGGDAAAANNGLYESEAAHGNYIAADGAFGVSKIYQQISGLTIGQTYAVTFDWAGAQQYGYDGTTTEGWTVNLASSLADSSTAQMTGQISDSSHGFTGWQTTTMTFTATSITEYLWFMATGTPSGEPPFSLLDNVTMSAVPEPPSWAVMIGGFAMVGGALRARRKSATSLTINNARDGH